MYDQSTTSWLQMDGGDPRTMLPICNVNIGLGPVSSTNNPDALWLTDHTSVPLPLGQRD